MGWYDRNGIAVAARTACVWEVTSRKVGNVHPNAPFVDATYYDFLLSAGAIIPVLADAPKNGIGQTILQAASNSHTVAKSNCNLGIILLLAPLASTWSGLQIHPEQKELGRGEFFRNLQTLSVRDTSRVYEAIRLVNPGGLGEVPEQDVKQEPTVTLFEAMKLAADRDMIARQYANGFADVFDFGVPAFLAGFERFGCVEAAIIDSQFRWLAQYPDSLIARKNGRTVAEEVQKLAAEVLDLGGIARAKGRRKGVALDRHLRSDGNKLNPGTTADLITACLFVALRENKVVPSAPFRWDVPDWL
jgi:triphosphoribosyl-dephospho-CoA synthase